MRTRPEIPRLQSSRRDGVRVRPPSPGKDWTDVHSGGFNRVRYHWGRFLPMSKPVEFEEITA